jgi:hypothetical protein
MPSYYLPVRVAALTVATFSSPAVGAQPTPPDTVRRIAELHQAIHAAGATVGPRVWPGFRPDTIPTLYVIPRRAKLFTQWRDSLPAGFLPLSGVSDAAWTDTQTVSFPRGRFIAFLSVDSTSAPGGVLGLALHEEFHAFYRAAARPGRRFGRGENAMLVATYPVFDVANEAAFALEGRLLGRALRAPTAAAARRLAREFLAVRERRQLRLDSAVAEFERDAELNEGLAQYALIRGLRELARANPGRWGAAADAEAAQESSLLDSLLAVGPRSVRRRFYATGSTIARLLDRLAGASWKERLVRDDATLQAALAQATGFGRAGTGQRAADRETAELRQLTRDAERAVAALDARRRAQRDSLLARPGLRLVVDPARLPGRRLDWCGFDPQNVLQTRAGELLHMRMLRVCAGDGSFEANFDQPVVEDRTRGVLRAVVRDGATIKLSAGGVAIVVPMDGSPVDVRDLRIAGPTVTIVAPRATLARRGDELWVVPVP